MIDSLLQSLVHNNYLQGNMRLATQRNGVAYRVRRYLQDLHLTFGTNFLSHDEHTRHIFEYLLTNCQHLWIDLETARSTRFTIVVYERFQNRVVQDVSGASFPLPDREPVSIEPKTLSHAKPKEEPLLLYCNTDLAANGYHYEWVRSV